MPDLNEFFKKPVKQKPYELEKLNGTRPCYKCEEDVAGALWDPIEYLMQWTCSQGHLNEYKVG